MFWCRAWRFCRDCLEDRCCSGCCNHRRGRSLPIATVAPTGHPRAKADASRERTTPNAPASPRFCSESSRIRAPRYMRQGARAAAAGALESSEANRSTSELRTDEASTAQSGEGALRAVDEPRRQRRLAAHPGVNSARIAATVMRAPRGAAGKPRLQRVQETASARAPPMAARAGDTSPRGADPRVSRRRSVFHDPSHVSARTR